MRWEHLAKLARELADQVRPPKDTDDADTKRRNGRGLWFTGPNTAGMIGILDPEGAAIIKAAIDPLSAPCPLTDDDGVKIQDDPRPAHQRRMDALLDIIARGVSAPGEQPCTDKAKIVVTIDLDTLREHVTHGRPHGGAPGWAWGGGGTDTTGTTGRDATTGTAGMSTARGSGSCQSGDVLSAATVRRMACDAAIIPVILGSQSQPLDVGRQERLVTRPSAPRSGSETPAAPSPAAPPPGSGPTRTTSDTGSTAGPPASPTSPCCVHDTTPTSTPRTSPRPSPTPA